VLSQRDLNRTLLLRQHLLERTTMPALEMVHHLIGLQAQDNLPPYLSLAARIRDFDPLELSDALERGDAVRFLTMRGTIHVLLPDDALCLRSWVQPALDQQSRSNQMSRPARDVPVERLVAAARRHLADGSLPVARLGELLAQDFPGVPSGALAHVARERVPMVQVPPRGLWRRSGGVVYQTVENHLGRDTTEVDVPDLVRRYLRAFGPATEADFAGWSGLPLRDVRAGLGRIASELVEVRFGEQRAWTLRGAARHPRGRIVRLLPAWDNYLMGHRDRDFIAGPERWPTVMPGGGLIRPTILVDGVAVGTWSVRRKGREIRVELEPFEELNDEITAATREEIQDVERFEA